MVPQDEILDHLIPLECDIRPHDRRIVVTVQGE